MILFIYKSLSGENSSVRLAPPVFTSRGTMCLLNEVKFAICTLCRLNIFYTDVKNKNNE